MTQAKKMQRVETRAAEAATGARDNNHPESHTRLKSSEVVVAMADALEDILRTEERRQQVA
jgi:hypothetical protein